MLPNKLPQAERARLHAGRRIVLVDVHTGTTEASQPGLFADCCGPSALCAVFDVLAFCGSQNIAHLLRGFGIIVEVHGLGYAARALVRICAALFSAASHTNCMKADLREATPPALRHSGPTPRAPELH